MADDIQSSNLGSLDGNRQAEPLERAEQALRRLTLLQQVTAALSEALTPGEVGAVVMGLGTRALDATSGRISMLRPDGQTVDVVASSGYTYVRTPLSLAEHLPTNEVIRTGKPLFQSRFGDLIQGFPKVGQSVEPLIPGALASAPLVANGRVIGAMTLVFDGDREFDSADREMLIALATQAAQALERSRLYELSLQVQDDLRRSRDQLAAILGGIAEGVTVQDDTGRLVYANVVAARMSGYASVESFSQDSPNVLLGFDLFDENGDPFPPDELPGRRVLRGEEPREVVIQFRPRGGGATHWAIIDAAAVRADSGRLQLVVNIFRDITAMRETVEERDQALADLRQAMRTRDEFLTSASHDLKNPLASIKATAQLLDRRLSRPGEIDVERLRDGLGRLDAIATRASGLVEELLDQVRMQMGRPLDLDRRPLDLLALTREAVQEQQQATERHSIALESNVPHVIGSWDPRRLGRVLSNLLDNAVKYSPQGGAIRVRVSRDQDWAAVEVSDTGVGVPDEDRERIFERFQRARNVEQSITGTGIGLASARHILNSHGGTIAVTSNVGSGSTFTVRLPIDYPPNESDSRPPI